ncbi:general transcription factor 3C polypeptide 3-like [Mytilus edulis]|uniref:general transcription factor 3C polypeptide 3-like n=1 Tax=Mytilus edulis TaxID=6550 RepID=UPI0039EEFBF6
MDPFKGIGTLSFEPQNDDEDDEGMEGLDVLSSLVAGPSQPTESVVELDQQLLSSNEALSSMIHQLKLPTKDVTFQYLEGKISFEQFSQIMEDKEGEKVYAKEPDIDDADYSPIDSPVEEDSPKKKKKGKQPRKPRKRMTDLPKHLEGLMGEANMKFAKGEYDEAISMCSELIRTAPKAIQPFQTLAMIYEEIGDVDKSMQFSLIAAYLKPADADAWIRLAEMALEKNDVNQAIKFYTYAIRADPNNTGTMWERCRLFEEIGHHKRALEGYIIVLKHLPEDEAEKYLQLARSVSKSYYEMGEKEMAVSTMKNAFESHPEFVTSEDVNLYIELLLTDKQFIQTVQVLVKYCGVKFTTSSKDEWTADNAIDINCIIIGDIQLTGCNCPEMIPVDLRTKLAVAMINLKLTDISKDMIEPIFQVEIEENGDLYLDIAEAYMDIKCYKEAKGILEQLVASTNYSLAAVWLKFAECLDHLKDIDAAVTAFSHVVEMAPSHVGARMSLAMLHQQQGKHDEALRALSQENPPHHSLSKQEQTLLLHKCHLLLSQNKHDELVQSCKLLMCHMFKDLTSPSFLRVVFSFKTKKHKLDYLSEHLKEGKSALKTELSVDDIWDVFVKVYETLHGLKRYDDLLELSVFAMNCPYILDDVRKSKQAEFMCFLACLLTKNGKFAFSFIRDLCYKDPDNNQVWNLLNQCLLISTESRHNKFSLRYLIQNPDHIPVALLNGHNASISGTYMYALGEYVAVMRAWPDNPLVSLCIGITFIHLAGQKFSAKKHFLLTQGLAFLNHYLELRGETQEPYYNIGRALHMLGLSYAAVHYYKKVLGMTPIEEHPDGKYDLSREAAYNLSLIYQASGSLEYAKQIVNKYLVI